MSSTFSTIVYYKTCFSALLWHARISLAFIFLLHHLVPHSLLETGQSKRLQIKYTNPENAKMRIMGNRFAIMYSGLNFKANGFHDFILTNKTQRAYICFQFHTNIVFFGIFHSPYFLRYVRSVSNAFFSKLYFYDMKISFQVDCAFFYYYHRGKKKKK